MDNHSENENKPITPSTEKNEASQEKKETFFRDPDDETVPYIKKSSLDPATVKSTHEMFRQAIGQNTVPYRLVSQAALPRDRFAAFFIDYIFISIAVYFIQVYHLLDFIHPFWLKILISFLSTEILYFFIFEVIAGLSIGKILCRLRVYNYESKKPGISPAFLRNVCRIFDYLFLFFIALLSMENSLAYQRLGDRVAACVVIKKTRKKIQALDLRKNPLSTSFIRMVSALLDLCIFSGIIYLALHLPFAQNIHSAPVFIVCVSFILFLYYFLFEFLASSTPAKLIFLRQSVLDNGEPLDASSALLRTLSRPLDIILAYPLFFLTKRKQRLGDLLADSLVLKAPMRRSAKIALLNLLVIVAALFYFFMIHPQKNWFVESPWFQQINIKNLSSVFTSEAVIQKEKDSSPALVNSNKIQILESLFSASKDVSQKREFAEFSKNENIYFFYKAKGFTNDANGLVDIEEDLAIENTKGEKIFTKKTIAHYKDKAFVNENSMLFLNEIKFPNESDLGNYKIKITLKDLVNQTVYEFERYLILQS